MRPLALSGLRKFDPSYWALVVGPRGPGRHHRGMVMVVELPMAALK